MFEYFMNRLREPGTLRSLAVVALAFRNGIPDSMSPDDLVNIVLLLLGGISAAIPEKKAVVPAVVQDTKNVVEETRSMVDVLLSKVSR